MAYHKTRIRKQKGPKMFTEFKRVFDTIMVFGHRGAFFSPHNEK